jgi:hypothetical protein
MAKKRDALESLIMIREYLRDSVELVPAQIVEEFNVVAQTLGASENWMIFGIKGSDRTRPHPNLAFNDLLKKEARR